MNEEGRAGMREGGREGGRIKRRKGGSEEEKGKQEIGRSEFNTAMIEGEGRKCHQNALYTLYFQFLTKK